MNKSDAAFILGDALENLKMLPDECVQTVVSSPPYFQLRSYLDDESPYKRLEIGLEERPGEYVARIVEIMLEVRRVLKPAGTIWLNLGDKYANDAKWGGKSSSKNNGSENGSMPRGKLKTGLKGKDLLGLPWQIAFALQDRGFWLRQDVIEEVELYCPCGCGYTLEERIWRYAQDQEIIWKKPNAIPESVKDRCTKSHEYIFIISKQEKYYFDHRAIQEAAKYDGRKQTEFKGSEKYKNISLPDGQVDNTFYSGGHQRWQENEAGEKVRNKRSVWEYSTAGYSGDHHATFPEDLIKTCILAGSAEGDVVLDMFCGAGTTAKVALSLGRKFIGIDLDADSLKQARQRIENLQVNFFR